LGDGPDVLGGGDGADDAGLLFVVGEALASEVGGAALGGLDNDGRLDIARSFEDSVGGGRGGNVLGGDVNQHVEDRLGEAYDGLAAVRIDLDGMGHLEQL